MDIPRTITITIPGAPDADLFPNRSLRRGGKRPYGVAAARLREDAKLSALAQMPPGWTTLLGALDIEVFVMYPPSRRVPDLSATYGALKAAEDGLQDSGLFKNDAQAVHYGFGHGQSDSEYDAWIRYEITEVAPPAPKTRRTRKR